MSSYDNEESAQLLPLEAGPDGDDPNPIPRFIQDQQADSRLKWIPPFLRRVGCRAVIWAKGPQPPRLQVIKTWVPSVQEAPIRLLNKYLPKRHQKIIALITFYFCWIFTFAFVFRQSTFVTEVEGYGEPAVVGCGNTFWGPGNSCGLDGINCRPFYNSSFVFRCPAECRKTWVLNHHAVGAQEVVYKPFVIGGPAVGDLDGIPIYRGDSFICGSAIHAGVIDNTFGGCGVVSLTGAQTHFDSTERNGITSISFDSYFPLSFTFTATSTCDSRDMRWELLIVSLVFTVILSVFIGSTAVFFFSIFTGVFVHVGFASDPPYYSSVAGLVSNLVGKFLPAAFCAFVIYLYCVKRSLEGLTAQIEKTVLWLGGCWLGALSNITLDWIPIQRLNRHDLEQQPGAKLALTLIITLLVCITIQQAYYFRCEGRFLRYLALYGIFIGGIIISLVIPGLSLRIHHYILGLLLLPGTSMQTRPALFYQGLLVGLFINGIARWGFDSVLQTPGDLRGDAPYDSLLPSPLKPDEIVLGLEMSNISFKWDFPPLPYDGFSVLVNDVERFRGFVDEGYGLNRPFVWNRQPGLAEPEYFRFGYMQGNINWDYSKAGVWQPDGSWVNMDDGPSRIMVREMNEKKSGVLRHLESS